MAKVGYWDISSNSSATYLVDELTENGFDAVALTGFTLAQLQGLDALYLVNPENSYIGLSSQEVSDLTTAVENGLDLVFFDRNVSQAAQVLPGATDVSFTRFGDANDSQIDVYPGAPTSFTSAFGLIDDSVLDGGDSSNHGFASLGTLPNGAVPLLTDGNNDHITAFSYQHGQGTVFYSTIPADYYSASAYSSITPDEITTLVGNAISHTANLTEVGAVQLTEEEIAIATSIFNSMSQIKGAFDSFLTGLEANYKALTGQAFTIDGLKALDRGKFLDIAQIKMLENADVGDQLSFDAMFEAAASHNDKFAFLEALQEAKIAGVNLTTIVEKGSLVLDLLFVARDAWQGMTAALSNDNEEAFGTVYDLTVGLLAGKAVALTVGSTAVTTASTAIAGAGVVSVMAVGGLAIAVGLGVGVTAAAINEKFDLVENVTDGFEGAALTLTQLFSEGVYATWLDSTPRIVTSEGLIFGGAGHDQLTGLGGDDTLVGHRGDDMLNGGAGADELRGGNGADTYYVDNVNDRVVELAFDYGASDTDTVYSSVSFVLPRATEQLFLTGAGNLNGTGNKWDNTIIGTRGANELDGKKGADELHGKGGDDIFWMTNDSDRDLFYGGKGEDSIMVANLGRGAVINLKEGTASYYGVGDELFGIENATGGNKADMLIGNRQDNVLDGGNGADYIQGNAGADILIGGAGKDNLYGGTDRAVDTFVFEQISDAKKGRKLETLHEFDLNLDQIDLRLIDANDRVAGNQSFEFSVGAEAHSVWISTKRNGDMKVFADVDGDAKADMAFLIDDPYASGNASPATLEVLFLL